MTQWITVLISALLSVGAISAQTVEFDDVKILERNRDRIKAMGDLRGDPKLMAVRVRFREADMLISGNDYRYGYLTVIPYAAMQTLTFSDIDEKLPREMRREAPLFHEDYAGQDQRWFRIDYATDDASIDVWLMVGRDVAQDFVVAVEDHSGKSVARYIDGLPQARSDAAFRGGRVFQTIETRKGRFKTDDFACVVLMTSTGFVVLGTDKNYRDRLDIAYSDVRSLAYEHAKASSYMGRMPGISAFKKEKHWFVIDHTLTTGESESLLLLLDENTVADFRDAAAQRTGLDVKTYALAAGGSTASRPIQLNLSTKTAPSSSVLMSAKTLRCTLGPGYRANWANQALQQDAARFDDASPNLIFEQIDMDAQTARLRHGDQTHGARVIAGSAGLTFLVLDRNQTLITSIFEQNGRLVCVHSRHAGDGAPKAGQFYGIAEVIE